MNYKDRLKTVQKSSQELGLDPKLDFKDPITGAKIQLFSDFCAKALIKMLTENFGSGDWGTQRFHVASKTFSLLQQHQVPCELVYGEVKIAGINAFETTMEGLKNALNKEQTASDVAMHVWINIGKDYIIDPTISFRINKYYDSKCPRNMIFNGKSNTLKKQQKLDYIPMLVGAKFLDEACGISLEYKTPTQTA